ncbi:hypothetical protein A2U01_0059327, partial [Trifolium medium]|nr:hypothetical protein [Trifolium medium]
SERTEAGTIPPADQTNPNIDEATSNTPIGPASPITAEAQNDEDVEILASDERMISAEPLAMVRPPTAGTAVSFGSTQQ